MRLVEWVKIVKTVMTLKIQGKLVHVLNNKV